MCNKVIGNVINQKIVSSLFFSFKNNSFKIQCTKNKNINLVQEYNFF